MQPTEPRGTGCTTRDSANNNDLHLSALFFLGLDSLTIARPKFNQNNTMPLITSSEAPKGQEKSRLSQGLEMIVQM
jgi:hypothetical protein